MVGADPRCDFTDLRASQRVPVVWGAQRAVLNRVLFGLARAASPSPFWVEIRGRQSELDGPGPGDLGWIRPDRLFVIGDLFETPPKDAPATVSFALVSFLRDPSAAAIADTMRLPSSPPALSTAGGAHDALKVVAVANVDRVDQLYPETPRAMQTVVRAFLRAGIVPYFSTRKATKRSAAADFVFQVVATSLGEWRTGSLVCEKAPEGASWKPGDNLPLTRLPSIAGALSGKIDPVVP